MHAFVDESIRGSTYLMCAVLVTPRDLASVRRDLTRLCMPGQRRVHFKKESDSRRRLIISRLVGMPFRARIYTAAGARPAARDNCLHAMIPDLLDQGVAHLVIEPDESLVVETESQSSAWFTAGLMRIAKASHTCTWLPGTNQSCGRLMLSLGREPLAATGGGEWRD